MHDDASACTRLRISMHFSEPLATGCRYRVPKRRRAAHTVHSLGQEPTSTLDWLRSLKARPSNDWSSRQRTIEPPGLRVYAQARAVDLHEGRRDHSSVCKAVDADGVDGRDAQCGQEQFDLDMSVSAGHSPASSWSKTERSGASPAPALVALQHAIGSASA